MRNDGKVSSEVGGPLRVLVVDDSKSIQRIMQSLLVKCGHKILAYASDGGEAFELYKEHKPDLVLLDITMPNVDGREGLKLIMSHDPDARVIMCSALKSPDVVNECMELGAIGFVDKDLLSRERYLESEIVKAIGLQSAA